MSSLNPPLNNEEEKERNPWLASAGIFEDDPFFEEFLEEMAAYRCEVDAAIEAAEQAAQDLTAGENQPV